MSRIIITGASGSIGIALIEKFLKNDFDVLVIANPNSIRNNNFKKFKNIKIIFSSLFDYDRIIPNETYDIFYHFAWSGGSERENVELNNRSSLSSISAVKLAKRFGCKVFVGAGSQAECGLQKTIISEKTFCNPITPFGISKLNAFYLTRYQCEQSELLFCWARILSVYGPFDGENTLVISTINKLLKSEDLSFSSAEQIWDYLYSEDAAEALFCIGTKSKIGGIYSLGSGERKKLKEYILEITSKFEYNTSKSFGILKLSKNSVRYLSADITRLKNEFNWIPKKKFSQGIEKTIEYCKSKL